jgi:hypothetical protein
VKDNFLNQCKGIITPLRALYKILSDTKVIGERSLVGHLIEKEGFCNGVTMNTIFSYIFDNLAEGCSVFLMAQTIEYGGTSDIYKDKFRNMFTDVKRHQMGVYERCSNELCSQGFHPKVNEMLEIRDTLYETVFQLHQHFPYLEFVILQMASDNVPPPKPTSHSLEFMEDRYNGSVYRVYALKSHKVSSEKSPLYKLIEYVPSNLLDEEYSDANVNKICEQGFSTCDFKIYIKEEDAGCFHNDPPISSANDVLHFPFVVALSISFGIISSMTI